MDVQMDLWPFVQSPKEALPKKGLIKIQIGHGNTPFNPETPSKQCFTRYDAFITKHFIE